MGTANYEITQFDRYLMLTRNPPVTALGNQMDALGTLELFPFIKTLKPTDGPATLGRLASAELEWRLSLPLTCLLLTILGLWLGEVPPRHGRYARLFPGILVLIIY